MPPHAHPSAFSLQPSAFSNRGTALIITLGIISVVAISALVFTLTMRIDRTAAQDARHRAQARQDIYTGLTYYMEVLFPFTVLPYLGEGGECYRTYPFVPSADASLYETNNCFGSKSDNSDNLPNAKSFKLFADDVRPLLPPFLADEAADVWSKEILPVTVRLIDPPDPEEGLEIFTLDGMTNTILSFLAINCSGLLPAAAQTNESTEAAAGSLWENDQPLRVFSDIPEDLRDTTFHALFDPNPYQFCLQPYNAGTPDAGVTNCFNINSFTNAADTQAWAYEFADVLKQTFANTSADYSDAALLRLAYNFLDFADTNRAPSKLRMGDDQDLPPSRIHYAYENLPLIYQVLLVEERDTIEEGSISYQPQVVVYYPFTPDPSPPEVDLYLCISTNAADFTVADPWAAPDAETCEVHSIPSLSWKSPFHTVSADKTFSFATFDDEGKATYHQLSDATPVYIWPRLVFSSDVPEDRDMHIYDEALLNAAMDGVRKWTAPGAVLYTDPRCNAFDEAYTHTEPGFIRHPGRCAMFEANVTEPATNINDQAFTDLNNRLGTPWYFPNRPLTTAAEIAYLFDDFTTTNILLGITQAHTAALVDRFTVLPYGLAPDSPPSASNAYTRVNPNSTIPGVIAHLAAPFIPSDPALLEEHPDSLESTFYKDILTDSGAITNAWLAARDKTGGRGWNTFSEFLPDLAAALEEACSGDLDRRDHRLLNDFLVQLPPRLSFRQNAYVVIVQAQRLSPKGRVLATQRAAFTILRDAFTGEWLIYHTDWLTEK